MELKKHFITINRPYQKSTTEVFEQKLHTQGVKEATLAITALGLYEAELNGKKSRRQNLRFPRKGAIT